MYRSRLRGGLSKRALSYLSSMDEDESILYYDIVGTEAHVIMLHEQGIINKEELKSILNALEQANKNGLEGIDVKEYEDIHEALEAFVIKHAGIAHGGKMHTARSRNDQVVLDLRLKIRDDIIDIAEALLEVVSMLLKRADEHKDTVMPMYTHMQHAQIGSMAHYLTAYASTLLRDYDRLESCYARVNQSPLGAAAIGGTSINIDRLRVASLLGFDSLVYNSLDATSSRDFLIEYIFVITSIMLNLSRMAEDIIIWSSVEFSFVELPDELTSSSSIMPQKKNPCPLELMRAKTATMLGILLSCISIIKALPFGYSRDMQESKRLAINASSIVYESLLIMHDVIAEMKVNVDKMSKVAEDSYAIALDIAEGLVMHGVAFREAHKIVGALVSYASNNGKRLNDLSREEIIDALSASSIASKPIETLLRLKDITPIQSIMQRASLGSPNPHEESKMIEILEGRLNTYRSRIHALREKINDTISSLQSIVESYTHTD
jgi:argininosuccinate lyase